MTRVLHFGVAARDDRTRATYAADLSHVLRGSAFESLGTSFTDSNEPFGSPLDALGTPLDERDAFHVIATLPEHPDEPATANLARTVGNLLRDLLPGHLRLVDYCIDSAEVWGEDERIHGPWALASVAGRRL